MKNHEQNRFKLGLSRYFRYNAREYFGVKLCFIHIYTRVNLFRHELVDSEPQWREAQKRKGEGVQRAVVSSNDNTIASIRYSANVSFI